MTNSVALDLDVQYAIDYPNLPTEENFRLWVMQALTTKPRHHTELVIRIVNEEESADLNQQYRHKTGPTNVLSFSFATLPQVPSNFIGDIIICAPVIAKEAMEQHKILLAHWAHVAIHGVLHLLEYDHSTELEANEMENLERHILNELGYADPYLEILETAINTAL